MLLSQVLSNRSSPQEKNFTYTDATVTGVPFEWVVVENSSSLWKVFSSDIAEGYNSTSTGAILYRIQHQGSAITGQTSWNRVRRGGGPAIPFINISWSESSNSTSIASDYKSGSITVSGALINHSMGTSIAFRSVTQTCTVRVN